jgi:hypothetical protein
MILKHSHFMSRFSRKYIPALSRDFNCGIWVAHERLFKAGFSQPGSHLGRLIISEIQLHRFSPPFVQMFDLIADVSGSRSTPQGLRRRFISRNASTTYSRGLWMMQTNIKPPVAETEQPRGLLQPHGIDRHFP